MTINEAITHLETLQESCTAENVRNQRKNWHEEANACEDAIRILLASQEIGAKNTEDAITFLHNDCKELARLLAEAKQLLNDLDKDCSLWVSAAMALHDMLCLPDVFTAVGNACVKHPIQSIPVVCSALRKSWKAAATFEKKARNNGQKEGMQ